MGDLALEVTCKDSCSGKFVKKVAIFEIKHGRAPIEQNQLRRYCYMINDPGEYFPKAEEVRVIFLMIKGINTNKGNASYSICELKKDLAIKILENSPTVPFDDIDKMTVGNTTTDNKTTDNIEIDNIPDSRDVDINISCGFKMITED